MKNMSKRGIITFGVFSLILSMNMAYAAHDHEDSHDHNQTDRDEYDLYERNRDDRDFSRFDYPGTSNESNTSNGYYYNNNQGEAEQIQN